ncbi:hypothetical protein AO263_14530 [Pseudomonas sp. NZIPFR-PS5]|nr:hypothetical protein AO263_14530 [Pseudomonas sp. NZIPFR-PS5]
MRRRLMVSTPITIRMTPKVFDTVNVSWKNGSAAGRAYASTWVRLSTAYAQWRLLERLQRAAPANAARFRGYRTKCLRSANPTSSRLKPVPQFGVAASLAGCRQYSGGA